jgi:uncharacterized protein YndB with AHSA1/START domain
MSCWRTSSSSRKELVAVRASGKATVTLPSDQEILITRELDAPRHLVYKAWTTPELVKRWWSGHRGEVKSVEIDTTEVYELPDAPEGEGVLNIVTFTEADGRTTLTLLVQSASRQDRDAILDSGMEVGMQEQMELLERLAISLR